MKKNVQDEMSLIQPERTHILLVDDRPENIYIVGQILKKEKYSFAISETGQGTFESIRERKPDLILLDILLPDIDGFEVCKKLKDDPETEDIPVVFLSGRSDVENRIRGFEIGAVDFISKPFFAREVVSRVRTHIHFKQTRELLARYNEKLEKLLEERTEDLRKNEQLFRSTFEHTITGMIILSIDGDILRVNQALCRFLDYSDDFLLDRKIVEFLNPGDQMEVQRDLSAMIRGDKDSCQHEARFVKRSGEIAWTVLSISPLFDDDHKMTNLFVHVQDIDAQRNAQKNLENTLHFQYMLAHIATALNTVVDFHQEIGNVLDYILVSFDVDIIYIMQLEEPGFSRCLHCRYAPGVPENNHEPDPDFLAPVDADIRSGKQLIFSSPEDMDADLKESVTGTGLRSLNICPLSKDSKVNGVIVYGKTRPWKWSSFLGNVFFTITTMIHNAWERYRNIQARLHAEEKQTQAIQMLEKSARMASIGVMAAGITHEINQPLGAIKITSDSITHWAQSNPGIIPDIILESLEEISGGTKRIDEIIQHMRKSWIVSENDRITRVDLNQTISSALRVLERQLVSHQIRLMLDLCKTPPIIEGIPVQLEQIIVNLVVNAMHALDEIERDHKKILITTTIRGHRVVLSIEDNGPGFPESVRERMFEPLFTTKTASKGSGLGLPIVRNFVQKFNGLIEADSLPRGGARFTIDFPVVQIADEPETESHTESE